MNARYTHDCAGCTFLGQWQEYDLYFCLQFGKIPTVIARYGDEGREYISGLKFAEPGLNLLTGKVETFEPLAAAKRIAIEQGLLEA